MDVFQRDLEYEYVCQFLKPHMRILEVGCGNGYSTDLFRTLAQHVDAFDYSEDMIKRAKANFRERNNRFIRDNVLALRHIHESYDAVVCIRVLINLRDLEEQRLALRNLAPLVKPNGSLILAEGFIEGFTALNDLRGKVGLPPLEPASINFYSSVRELLPELEKQFVLTDKFHLGAYDYLTRVFYPLVVGPENAKHNTVFSEKARQLAREFSPDSFEQFSRIRGFVFRKHVELSSTPCT